MPPLWLTLVSLDAIAIGDSCFLTNFIRDMMGVAKVTILESLIEGMFWQETLVGPQGYLDPYLKGVVNVSACWRQTHGNWHRVAAQMMKELMAFITTEP